jgi:hypothetical protein
MDMFTPRSKESRWMEEMGVQMNLQRMVFL